MPGGSASYDYGSYYVKVPEYDANGNILELERWAPSGGVHLDDLPFNRIDRLAYTYTKGTNQLASVADAASTPMWQGVEWDAEPWAYKYDRNGAMTWQKETATNDRLEWETVDENSQPTWVTLPDGTDLYYRYSGDNQRITEEIDTGSGTPPFRRFVRVGGEVVGVFLDGALEYWNIGGTGGGGGRIDATGTRHYYYTDHLGSIRAVVKKNGDLVQAADYYPFGLELPGRVYVSGGRTREGYTGYENDREAALLDAGARFYMPSIGRFASIDRFAGKYPPLSPYTYAGANPFGVVDLNGDSLYVGNLSEEEQAALLEEVRSITGLGSKVSISSRSMLIVDASMILADARMSPIGSFRGRDLVLNNAAVGGSSTAREFLETITKHARRIYANKTEGNSNANIGGYSISLNFDEVPGGPIPTDPNASINPATFGIGMRLLHELGHTAVGQRALGLEHSQVRDDDYVGPPPGRIETFLNGIRSELGPDFGSRVNYSQESFPAGLYEGKIDGVRFQGLNGDLLFPIRDLGF